MKKFFNEEDRQKEKGKIIELSFGVDFEEIKDNFEDVDPNGEEKIDDKSKNEDKNKEPEKIEIESKNKKRRNKKKQK